MSAQIKQSLAAVSNLPFFLILLLWFSTTASVSAVTSRLVKQAVNLPGFMPSRSLCSYIDQPIQSEIVAPLPFNNTHLSIPLWRSSLLAKLIMLASWGHCAHGQYFQTVFFPMGWQMRPYQLSSDVINSRRKINQTESFLQGPV